MSIDEDKNIFDLSDHNLIQVSFNINVTTTSLQSKTPKRKTVLSTKEEHCKKIHCWNRKQANTDTQQIMGRQ